MKKLVIKDLLSLENYDSKRDEIKNKLLEHKKNRSISIGNHMVLLFEDYETIKYQVQEMLRIEKIFNKNEMQSEIDAYSPLIPDGTNLKATMLIMYTDIDERQIMLQKLHNIENKIWISINDGKKIYAVSDEDLERSKDNKTSAVHFLRFQLDEFSIKDFKKSYKVSLGSDHNNYEELTDVSKESIDSLRKDLD
tara:strand:- start:339 stop:920 length:582 start_codon:yes stop_codon:yes gene_type:complete